LPCSRAFAFLAARLDEAALELRDAAHDRQHQLAGRGGRVTPALREADEATGASSAMVKIPQDFLGGLLHIYAVLFGKYDRRKFWVLVNLADPVEIDVCLSAVELGQLLELGHSCPSFVGEAEA
jgi:hypothetical protein